MARHPNQDANLIPFRNETEAREAGKKGGKASGKSRAAMKTFKEALIDGLTPEEQAVMLKALKHNAEKGNLPSLEFLLKLVGQHPDQGTEADRTVTVQIKGKDDYGD